MATFNFIINSGKTDKLGRHPILIRFRHKLGDKSVSIKLSCLSSQWDKGKQRFKKNLTGYSAKNNFLNDLSSHAQEAIDELNMSSEEFNTQELLNRFKSHVNPTPTINTVPLTHIYSLTQEYKAQNRHGNAKVYHNLFNSLKSFTIEESKTLASYKDITPLFLDKYEQFLRRRKSELGYDQGDGGISLKMRTLRAAYNLAIRYGLANQGDYPFDTYKISNLKLDKTKLALSADDFLKFKNFDIQSNPELVDSYNYFMFSYYVAGINFADLIRLKWSDIVSDRVNYRRSKNKKLLSIQIIEPAQKILNYYKRHQHSSKWIFPILLQDEMTPNQIQNRKKKELTKYNRQLKQIGSLVGIKTIKITSYVCRHSFANHLKSNKANIYAISQLLGHDDIKTTETYLGELGNKEVDNVLNSLL